MGFVPNERQRQAIEHVHGPMLVVAGAGTGKTTVLAHRVAHLIANGHARADEIVALTYTDAAAKHLNTRVSQVLGQEAAGLQASTFHAYGNNLLTTAGRSFGVLDDKDVWVLLRRRLTELPLKHYQPPRDPGEFLETLQHFFSRCQDELVDAARYARYVEELRAGKHPLPRVAPPKVDDGLRSETKLERCAEIAAVFRKVEAMFATGNSKGPLGTFGDMITGAVRLLREDPAVLAQARQRARFLLIDEFQDANVALIELARLVAGNERNVFAVGDPDQAIYRFRGASSAAFDEFLRRFPNAQGVVLIENQRSTSHILACAHAVISRNPEVDRSLAPGVDFRRQKLVSAREQRALARSVAVPAVTRKARASSFTLPLFAEDDDTPEVAAVRPEAVEVVLGDKNQEATDVAEQIQSLMDGGKAGNFAVIYRQHIHANEIAYELAIRGVPAVVKGIDALETPEGRDLMAALGAVSSLSRVDDIFRVSAFPVFGLDAAEVRRRLYEGAREASYPTLLEKIPSGAQVMQKIEASRAYAASVEWQMAPVSQYVVREFKLDAQAAPIGRICKFIAAWREKAITEKGTLEEFIDYMDYFRAGGGKLDLTPEPSEDVVDPVQLMTAHASKGREFDRVFILRANSPSFPGSFRENIFEFPQALREMPSPDDNKKLHDEEERRLFYVAMTRAKDHLSIYTKPGKGKTKQPSGYVRDLMAPSIEAAWTQRQARPATVGRIEAATAPQSGVASWMLAPPAAIAPDTTLSATAIEAYDTCPLKFKLSREWRLPGPVSAAMLFGNVMHAVLRDYHEAEIAGRPRDEAQVQGLFRTMMADTRFDDPIQARLYGEQGARQLSEYCRLRNERAKFPVQHAEQNFEVKISGVRVRGRMDRVDDDGGRRRIVDFKTGKAYDQRKADESVQLGIYALAARGLWGETPQALVIYNLEDNNEVVSKRSSGELAALEAKVEEIAQGIRESLAHGVFEARPEFHCRWCDFRSVCPATEQRLYSITRGASAN